MCSDDGVANCGLLGLEFRRDYEKSDEIVPFQILGPAYILLSCGEICRRGSCAGRRTEVKRLEEKLVGMAKQLLHDRKWNSAENFIF